MIQKYFKYIIISGIYSSAEILMACATCFGDPNSNAGKGMDMAIMTLLGIIGPLLFAIAIGIISIGIKSKRLNETK